MTLETLKWCDPCFKMRIIKIIIIILNKNKFKNAKDGFDLLFIRPRFQQFQARQAIVWHNEQHWHQHSNNNNNIETVFGRRQRSILVVWSVLLRRSGRPSVLCLDAPPPQQPCAPWTHLQQQQQHINQAAESRTEPRTVAQRLVRRRSTAIGQGACQFSQWFHCWRDGTCCRHKLHTAMRWGKDCVWTTSSITLSLTPSALTHATVAATTALAAADTSSTLVVLLPSLVDYASRF